MIKTKRIIAALSLLVAFSTVSCNKQEGPVREAISHKDDYQQAYTYGFPMIAGYKAMYQFAIDKTNLQYKAPFNQIWNDSKTFTPKDTAIVTPNADTPYSMVEMDLRAEPLVFCLPKVDKGRYYSVQLADMYSYNVGYMGSRTTGNDPGCYVIAGPSWKGETPKGIKKVFPIETQFGFAIFRTQLFNAADMPNVLKIQKGYVVEPLSTYLKQLAPPAAPAIDWPAFNGDDPFKLQFPKFVNFLLQFCPENPQDKDVRAKMAAVGIAPGQPWDESKLSEAQKGELAIGVKEGFDAIGKRVENIGKTINGWQVGAAQGDRSFYKGDYLLLAAAAKAGIYGNDPEEAMYPLTRKDGTGAELDGSKHNYTLTFAKGELPPVNAFWSITMYDGKTQLLIENPINRYLINSPMLPGLKKNADGSVTLYIQKDAPAADKKANWLPAPNDTIYMVMRLYWPKEPPQPSILPAGDGAWKPPAVTVAQ
jgi:hypothetical protein